MTEKVGPGSVGGQGWKGEREGGDRGERAGQGSRDQGTCLSCLSGEERKRSGNVGCRPYENVRA